eukprot:jgi/Tetstr1/436630/TSEL_025426.t1
MGPSEERLHSPVVIVLDEYSGLLRNDLEHILGALQPHRIRTAEVCETRMSVDDVPVQIGLIKQEELVLGEGVSADIQQNLVSRAKAIVITKKTRAEVPLCLVFAAQSVETMVAHAAKSQPADLRVYPSEDDARKGSWGAPLQEFAARLRNQSGGGPLRQQLEAAQYTLPEGVLAFYVTPADRTGITDPSSAAGAASSSSTRSRASTDTITVMRAEIQAVWPRDDDDVYLPVQGALGEVVAPDWAAGLVVSRVRAAGIEGDEKDMRKRVTRGRPDAKARKLMAASSTAQPPGELCWMNAADKKQSDADKKRKRPVKKRPGKKLTVAESEAESEAEAEAEAARSRRVPRARKNKNKQ